MKSAKGLYYNTYYIKEKNQIHIHYMANIYDNLEDPLFHEKLNKLGFKIIEEKPKKNLLKVELPMNWSSVILDEGISVIVDHEGRARLTIIEELKISILQPRYTFEIEMVECDIGVGNMKKTNILIIVKDNMVKIHHETIPEEYVERLLEQYKNDRDHLLHSLEVFGGFFMDEKYPEWKDELAYW